MLIKGFRTCLYAPQLILGVLENNQENSSAIAELGTVTSKEDF